ncbi:hypothetical protein PIB30_048125, partial [Stylosanthes scabra]|nr:hypothetical protein [Stylosanthes scabra]
IVLFSPLFLVGTIPTSPWYYLYDSVHLSRSERIKLHGPLCQVPAGKRSKPHLNLHHYQLRPYRHLKRRKITDKPTRYEIMGLTN